MTSPPVGALPARPRLSPGQARRIALAAQGFMPRHRPKARVGVAHLRGVVDRLKVVQIDRIDGNLSHRVFGLLRSLRGCA